MANQENSLSWIPIVASLIGGGAVGSVITVVASLLRNRIPVIRYKLNYSLVFRSDGGPTSLKAKVSIKEGAKLYAYDNLHIIEIEMFNRSNRDFDKILFGIELTKGDRLIHIESKGESRFHNIESNLKMGLRVPQNNVDITLTPFNRKNICTLKLYVVTPKTVARPRPIKLQSPQSIRFIEKQDVSSALLSAALLTVRLIGTPAPVLTIGAAKRE